MKSVLLVILLIVFAYCSVAPNVNVQLKATWKSTSFLQEASEYFSGQFWDFFKVLKPFDDAPTEKQEFERAIQISSLLQGESQQKLLEYALSTRYFSPKVTVFQQLALSALKAASNPTAPEWFVVIKKINSAESCLLTQLSAVEVALRSFSTYACPHAFNNPDQVYPFDHEYPSNFKAQTHLVILYGLLGTPEASQAHDLLVKNSGREFKYLFRHYDDKAVFVDTKDSLHNKESDTLMNLQGYGVELQIKTLEYKQMDDSILHYQKETGKNETNVEDEGEVQGIAFSDLIAQYPEHASQLRAFKEHLVAKQVEESSSLLLNNNDGLKRWELKDIGLQAAQLIMKAKSPQEAISMMQQVAQDFPAWSYSLTKIKLESNDIKQEVQQNQQENFEAGKNYLIINGLHQDIDKLTASNLFDTLKTEMSLVHSLTTDYYVPKKQLPSILRGTPSTSTSPEEFRFDLARQFKDEIGYLNDVANDGRYAQFPAELQTMLWPTYYGQMRFVRKNLFESVFIVDPLSKAAADSLQVMQGLFSRGYPVRFGVLFIPVDEIVNAVKEQQATEEIQTVGVTMEGATEPITRKKQAKPLTFSLNSVGAKLWIVLEHLHRTSGLFQALDFLLKLRNHEHITEETIRSELGYWGNYESVVTNPNYKRTLNKLLRKAMDSLGIGFSSNVVPALLFNGKLTKSFQGNAEQVFWNALQPEYQEVINLIRANVLTDNDDVQKKIMQHYKAFSKFSPLLFSDTNFVRTSQPLHKLGLPYIHYPGTESSTKFTTHFIVVDVSKNSGVKLAIEGLKFLQNSATYQARSRLSVIPLVSQPSSTAELVQRVLIAAGLVEPSPINDIIELLNKVVERSDDKSPLDASFILQFSEKNPKIWKQVQKLSEQNPYLSKFDAVTQTWLYKKPADANFIIVNGRLIQIEQNQPFAQADFEMLDNLEFTARAAPVIENLDQITLTSTSTGVPEEELTSSYRSDWMYGAITTLVYAMFSNPAATQRSRIAVEKLNTKHSALILNPNSPLSLPILAIVNPLSGQAQKLASYVQALAIHFQFETTVILNPLLDNTEVPLKSWYRYVLEPTAQFDNQTGRFIQPSALFKKVASRNILTLNMDVPETWLIESTYAVDDLDNINLQAYKKVKDPTLYARYQLENIVVTGSCIDLDQPHNPPRGLQLELHPQSSPTAYSDTLVMANYGYFQLKANPNVWSLTLSDRHSTIYSISNDEAGSNGVTLPIHVTSFDGPILTLKIQKRPGMQKVELLEDDDKDASLWGRFKSAVFGKSQVEQNATETDNDRTINVFSIASGHMYERLLKIMVLSVIKNTKKNPVKFWFIKNYLSPQFKEVLPLMAKHYNFSYQFVTYKWPSWLHKQTQKQRIIWAYKVLFLDVLFPLKVKKIIYVDSDQVTRADLTELYHDLNMQGKPLAYTPMGDSRTDMEGYRFWKTGYWANHLGGKSYHISALYVVDIDRLRKMYAGDQFRMYYDNLSKDPNSLSNLDQDLPNYAQHVVPIYSLDKSWLWCETWCSDEDKKTAKTIDLCNNPMTKEHKLESARRIIPEWTSLDEEIKQFENTLKAQTLTK